MNNEADIKELNDRLTKVKDEIAGILTSEKEDSFFAQAAKLVTFQLETYDKLTDGSFYELDEAAMKANNDELYNWKLEANYEDSFANPAKAEAMYAENEANAKAHYEYLSKLGALYNEE